MLGVCVFVPFTGFSGTVLLLGIMGLAPVNMYESWVLYLLFLQTKNVKYKIALLFRYISIHNL